MCMMLDNNEWEVPIDELKNYDSKAFAITTDAIVVKSFDNISLLATNANLTWAEYAKVCSPVEELLTTPLFQAFVYILYGAVFFVALTGNGLVCFVVWSTPRMKTVTNYFIVNLAVGDILMTLFCVPFSFVSVLVLRYWPFGALMCKVVNYSQAVSVLVSAYTLLAISLDRYAAIMRPLRPRLGRAAAKLVVAAVWGGAMATAAPISVVSQLQKPTDWHQLCQADICLEQWDRQEQSSQYTCALLALQFALPLGALVCTYARIAHAVWGGRPPGEAESARDSRMQRSKRKMIKMMVTVVVVFTVCWLPLNLFIVLWTVHEQDEGWSTWPGMPFVWFACHWLAMSHSCCNPFIYCYMNTRYRRAFKQVFSGMFCLRLGKPSRFGRRSSLGDGMPMSELVGINGITRRGTNSSCISRLQRAPTCSSCTSLRRAPGAGFGNGPGGLGYGPGSSSHGAAGSGNGPGGCGYGPGGSGYGPGGGPGHGPPPAAAALTVQAAHATLRSPTALQPPVRALSVRTHFR